VCVIVDNDVVALALTSSDPAYAPLRSAIFGGRHKLVHGGKLTREYVSNRRLSSLLKVLDERGLSRIVRDGAIAPLEAALVASNACSSNDTHVIALAQASNTRLLCSEDKALMDDFHDKALLDKPRGRVYRDRTHSHLVKQQCRSCK
jgi:hypothetical protein